MIYKNEKFSMEFSLCRVVAWDHYSALMMTCQLEEDEADRNAVARTTGLDVVSFARMGLNVDERPEEGAGYLCIQVEAYEDVKDRESVPKLAFGETYYRRLRGYAGQLREIAMKVVTPLVAELGIGPAQEEPR